MNRKLAALALLAGLLLGASARFAGAWTWKNGDADFQITIRNRGGALSGEMTGTAMNGNRVSIGTFTGPVKGNQAHVEWHFKDGNQIGPVAGTADVHLEKGALHWKLTYTGTEDCWFPREATLKRSK